MLRKWISVVIADKGSSALLRPYETVLYEQTVLDDDCEFHTRDGTRAKSWISIV